MHAKKLHRWTKITSQGVLLFPYVYECAKFKLEYSIKSLKFYNFRIFSASIWNLPFLRTFGLNYYPLYLGKIFIKNFDQGK